MVVGAALSRPQEHCRISSPSQRCNRRSWCRAGSLSARVRVDRGEWIAIDGSKFRAVASVDVTRERVELRRYLDKVEKTGEEQHASFDQSAVQGTLEKLRHHPEPDAKFMLVRQMALPAYNVQTAVYAEHAIIVAHSVTLDASDSRCLKPMADAAKEALGVNTLRVVADAGYSNGEQIAQCEEAGITPFVPVMRTVNNQGNGKLFGRTDFRYDAQTDSYTCPGDKKLLRKHTNIKDRYTMYKASSADSGACSQKPSCTLAPSRSLARHLYGDALNRMEERVTPEAMKVRRQPWRIPLRPSNVGSSGTRVCWFWFERRKDRSRHCNDGLQPQADHESAWRGLAVQLKNA